jgi:phosphoglycerate dehydrogenase-like enzyme
LTDALRITLIEPLPDWIRGIYDSAFEGSAHTLQWASDLTDAELTSTLHGTDVIVTGRRRVTSQFMTAAGAELQLVQVVGRAPWAVDLEHARDAGISVSILPHRGAIAVAEHTMALLLGLMRKLVAGHVGTMSCDYQQLEIEPIRTSERKIAFNWLKFSDIQQLHGKTIGLVGLGDIGLEVARRARAFDMKVLYTKRDRLPAHYDVMAEVTYAPLNELLESSDVVSLNAPHTPQTECLMNAETFSRMKANAVLVNTSRGGLVDEKAMVDALRSGRIAGAGLDVFLDEPLPVGHGLLDLDNVLLSPHTGGGTGGGQKGVVADIKANIDRLANGETPHQKVVP